MSDSVPIKIVLKPNSSPVGDQLFSASVDADFAALLHEAVGSNGYSHDDNGDHMLGAGLRAEQVGTR